MPELQTSFADMLIKLLIFTFLTFSGTINGKVYDYQPQQVHLAFGGTYNKEKKSANQLLHKGNDKFSDNVSEMVVTWSTMDDSTESIVEYGINGFALTAQGVSEKFVDGGDAHHSQYIHKVKQSHCYTVL